MIKKLTAIFALAFLPLLAQAHYLWIETGNEDSARVYFGEFNEGVREKAGGRLDERDTLEGRMVRAEGASEPLSFTKEPDHFAAKIGGAGWLLVEDLASEVKDWTSSDIGIVKPMFYARAAFGKPAPAAQPGLMLDIIPDPKNPRQVRVFFNKEPLVKAKLMVHAPNQWSQELETNSAGEATIATPWPGRYVLEVIHKERTPGEFKGKPYEAIRHRVTFSREY